MRVFISRTEESCLLLKEFCLQKGLRLIAKSLISFVEKERQPLSENFDFVFFGSKTAVKLFFKNYSVSPKIKIACVGTGTAELLQSYGHTPHFVGQKSGDTYLVAQSFLKFVGDKKVLFPLSQNSANSIDSIFPNPQKQLLVLYETKSSPLKIDPCEYYIFTSPSNVHSFLLMNEIPLDSKIISWGKTTSRTLEENSLMPHSTLIHSSEKEVIELLNNLF